MARRCGHGPQGHENANMGVRRYWGQDDFCILIPFEHDTVHQIYSRVRQAVAKYDDGVGFWPSMGVYPIDSNEKITIDAQAKAMFTNRRAKNDFKERIAIFRPEEYEREIAFHRTLTEFQYALSNGRITYYLQPQVDMEPARSLAPKRSRAGSTRMAPSFRPPPLSPLSKKAVLW